MSEEEGGAPGSASGVPGEGLSEKDQEWIAKYNFKPDQLAELKECFEMFDRQGINMIAAGDLGNILRSMGQNPTEADMKTMLDESNVDENGNLSLDEYIKIVGERGLKTDTEMEEELEEALRVFDKEGMGTLDAEEFRNIMKTYGEVLDDDDIAEMLKVAEVAADGKIDYGEFMRKICAKD